MPVTTNIELILGGARSGKSALAEHRAQESRFDVTYIATGTAGDEEMERRIAHHRARRPKDWGLIEEPLHLADVLKAHAGERKLLLVDCLTLWLTNLLFKGRAAAQAEAGLPVDCPLLQKEMESFLKVLPTLPGRVILVSNEVGLGIVPLGASTRLYVDEAGRMNQQVAALADQVTFVVAGLSYLLKNPPLEHQY